MQELKCFVIIPSNRNGEPIHLVEDEKRGLVELPSGCYGKDLKTIPVDFDTVYENIIKAAIAQINYEYKDKKIQIKCTRGQDLPETGDIVRQIIEHICTADITVTDITAHNPNVFLEYGIRLSVRDTLNILIRHKKANLPFNIERLRWIAYSMDLKGANEAKENIAKFIRSYIDGLDKPNPIEAEKFFKRYVEIFNGRQLERQLLRIFEKAPELVADFIQFLFVNGTSIHIKQESFKFLNAVQEILQDDPSGQQRAIEHLEMVSNIEGLGKERLKDTYYKLWELCNANDALKVKGEYYLSKAQELES